MVTHGRASDLLEEGGRKRRKERALSGGRWRRERAAGEKGASLSLSLSLSRMKTKR